MTLAYSERPSSARGLTFQQHWPNFPTGWARWIGGLLLASVVLRFVALGAVPLVPEEAYYWMYAQHPSLSYFDHPPMVAWVIGAGTAIFGDTEFGVRIVGCLLMLAATAMMYGFARAWHGRAAATIAAALMLVLPLYFGAGFIATMDSPLLFFWMAALVGVTAALRHGKPWGWYLAGVGLGGAMLSKYTGVFIAAGTGLCVLAHHPWRRRWLASPHPYLGLLLGFALFTPVIIWNAQHDWASFRFQFVDRFEGKTFELRYVLKFLGYQLLAATPMLLLGFAAVVRRAVGSRRRLVRPRTVVALAFSLPLLAVMAYKSLRYDIHINWTLPAFLTLLPAFARWFLVRLRTHTSDLARRHWWRQLTWTAAICLSVNVGLLIYLLLLQPHLRVLSAFGPWDELAVAIERHEDALERATRTEPLVVVDGPYRLPSIVAFYRTPHERDADAAQWTTSEWILGGRGLAYAYWSDPSDWVGRDCIYVFENDHKDRLRRLRGRFDSVEVVDEVDLRSTTGSKSGGRYGIAICKGLRVKSLSGEAEPRVSHAKGAAVPAAATAGAANTAQAGATVPRAVPDAGAAASVQEVPITE